MSKLKTEALAHYERLAFCRTKREFLQEGYFGDSCPLCREYCSDYSEEDCIGCPVSIKTEQGSCYGSPWHPMVLAISHMSDNDVLKEPLPEAVAMRLFLEGLDWSGQP